jgi:YidC/Oxa1 family membrane protein insertase
MDNVKLFLTMGLIFLGLLLYQAWQEDYAPKPHQPGFQTGTTPTTANQNSDVPTINIPAPVPNTIVEASTLPNTVGIPTPPTQQGSILDSRGRIKVNTDLLNIEIDTLGGDVRLIDLLNYPLDASQPEEVVRFMNDRLPLIFVVQSGLIAQGDAPSHQAQYRAEKSSYTLKEGDDKLDVNLIWESPENDKGSHIRVTKTYHFERGNYVVKLSHKVENLGTTPWAGRLYGQLQRTQVAEFNQSDLIHTYMGAAVSSPESRYEKIDFSDILDGGTNGHIDNTGEIKTTQQTAWKSGWIAMLQHYFVASLVPASTEDYNYYSKYYSKGARYAIGMYGPGLNIKAGEQHSFELSLYVGPKLQDKLEALAPNLELTVDYGLLWFIAQPLFWVLKFIHDIVGNWGWSIILLTILIKLTFFQLSASSYKSMANMRRIHPRLLTLKERHADDRAALNKSMMELYKKEKINPLGGCLPVLVQIPVFIALYWVLLESVDLRQASFILWLDNLSKPDPYFILPLVMGATMLLQHRLNPSPLDPVQQKVMMMLPIVFTVFFAFFPAGLVLYWVVNNMLSIAQQWYITKKIAPDAKIT